MAPLEVESVQISAAERVEIQISSVYNPVRGSLWLAEPEPGLNMASFDCCSWTKGLVNQNQTFVKALPLSGMAEIPLLAASQSVLSSCYQLWDGAALLGVLLRGKAKS